MPRVGIPRALTYHYRSSRILERFLREAGATVVLSPRTTPQIHAAGTTLGSADYCLSLRMLIGHVHHLITHHPDLDFILVPNLCREDERRNSCSKYRDAGGVALRSLTSVLGYLRQHASGRVRLRADTLLQAAGLAAPDSARFPILLQPYVWSLRRLPMLSTCFGLYCDIFGVPWPLRVGEPLVPAPLRRVLAPHLQRCLEPFAKAYDSVMQHDTHRLQRFLAQDRAVRLAIVARDYLLAEPLLTADLKAWFLKAGARVITPGDVWPEDMPAGPEAAWAFYDSHWHFDAFVELVAPYVDGFVFAGCFGCHPDAFILEFLLDRVRRRGIPAWLLRYDEQAGSAGFQTRYETIMRFLEMRRDRRLAEADRSAFRTGAGSNARGASAKDGNGPTADRARKPLIIWPHMSDTIDLVVGELAYQAGLQEYVQPPRPVSDLTLELAGDRYAESCCPYAFSTGSLVETLSEHFRARPSGPPRRIVALMARGEGPCTLGLYLPAQARELPEQLRATLERGGHSLEFISLGLANVAEFVGELAALGNRRRLGPIVDYVRMRADGTFTRLPWWRHLAMRRRLWKTIATLAVTARAKLEAAEALRARALLVRAHETVRGATTAAYRQGLAALAAAHTVADIRRARQAALAALGAVPQDGAIRPRVAVVGEIYVVQASYANRGVVDNLLGQHRVEVVEGTTLGKLIGSALRELRRRTWADARPLRSVLRWLWARNVLLLHRADEGREARPFINVRVGGEGDLSVAQARTLVEAGVDGVVHLFPFKCMPEGIARLALAEVCRLYGVPYLPLSFNRELEIERVKTEVATFAVLLHARIAELAAGGQEGFRRARAREVARRRAIGAAVNALHRGVRRRRFAVA
ncbi:MAG: acyl-CoA dehydratase activase-related protein [Armatimonadota bacterium]|nr:acyl-CoA dehydratase activase-related protein [Armatimonadota bacterium]MDR7463920.1 acyl-CoA dehydratase activase-related protein [Armatimonadota bacterium]MDR7468941.1 acyl-CoA dehydratase activase-related protein [Armatimonadota bacterium]MDR7475019.1 acyl-CoA dehydratase activase-related protein [Armatimonadota bacterium]MDR7539506.1 acyl-CoA dehydratase activase-related protein [Armatimonadota bacterium]